MLFHMKYNFENFENFFDFWRIPLGTKIRSQNFTLWKIISRQRIIEQFDDLSIFSHNLLLFRMKHDFGNFADFFWFLNHTPRDQNLRSKFHTLKIYISRNNHQVARGVEHLISQSLHLSSEIWFRKFGGFLWFLKNTHREENFCQNLEKIISREIIIREPSRLDHW